MSKLKDENPGAYTAAFKEGVERAQTGRPAEYLFFDGFNTPEKNEAIQDGYRAALAAGTAKKK